MSSIQDVGGWARLDRVQYLRDYSEVRAMHASDSLKLEAAFEFSEPSNTSFRAFEGGDLQSALTSMTEMRKGMVEEYDGLKQRGVVPRRLRIVPSGALTDYLEWELQVLFLRALAGEDIRVGLECPRELKFEAGIIPELLFIGDQILWQVLYDTETRQNIGALRAIAEPAVLTSLWLTLGEAQRNSEPLLDWLPRNVERFRLPWPRLVLDDC